MLFQHEATMPRARKPPEEETRSADARAQAEKLIAQSEVAEVDHHARLRFGEWISKAILGKITKRKKPP